MWAAPVPSVLVMFTSGTLLTFALAAVVVLGVPGQAVAYVVTRSLEGGRVSGLSSALGLGTGALVHAVAAAVGLAALLASSNWALTVVQLAGATYLVHLGIRQLRSNRVDSLQTPSRASLSPARLFADGVVLDVLNPTKVIFFTAFLPQFIDPARGSPSTQLLVLALCFVPLAYLVYGTYAVVAARVLRGLGEASALRGRINRSSGAVYLGLAAFTVLA